VEQLALNWREWGGARKGAGRKKRVRSRVAHRTRGKISKHDPLHVTVKCLAGLPSLRARGTAHELIQKLRAGSERGGFRLVHFSLQRDHVHMIVEADDRGALASGMKGLLVRMARALNRRWERAGKVFRRFHDHVLRGPTEVRNAIRYVLMNARRHGVHVPANRPDPLSSGSCFDGWSDFEASPESLVARARSWLLRVGWRSRGLIHLAVPTAHGPGRAVAAFDARRV
jgi:REP element-mobilizing transposase RayT